MLYDNAFLFPLKIGISTDEDFLYRQDMIDWIIKYKKDDINKKSHLKTNLKINQSDRVLERRNYEPNENELNEHKNFIKYINNRHK